MILSMAACAAAMGWGNCLPTVNPELVHGPLRFQSQVRRLDVTASPHTVTTP